MPHPEPAAAPSPAGTRRREPLPIAAILAVRLAEPVPGAAVGAAVEAAVEAVVVRAMAATVPPIAAELVPLPLLPAADPRLITYAAVLRPAPDRAQDDPDRILADARKAAKRALRRGFGRATRVVVRAADDVATADACLRAFAGNPRIPDPDEAPYP